MSAEALAILAEFGIQKAYHVAPLHYLPFISRSRALLSRSRLKEDGYGDSHFRRTSHKADFERGFGDRIYLSPYQAPPILLAKLRKGFPHVRIGVPCSALVGSNFDLCRFSVARSRYLRRLDKPGPSESITNGRYYEGRQLPVARTRDDVRGVLAEHYTKSANVEIQVQERLPLPSSTTITCFSAHDEKLARRIAAATDMPWEVEKAASQTYNSATGHVSAVVQFVDRALSDCVWKGNGIDFDRL